MGPTHRLHPTRAILMAGLFLFEAGTLLSTPVGQGDLPTATASPSPSPVPTATLPSATASTTSGPGGSATASPTSSATLSPTPSQTDGPSATASASPSISPSPTETLSPSPSATASPSSSASVSPTPSASPTPTSAPVATEVLPRTVLINELAWSGTQASANDEWIELHNPESAPIDLAGWHLTDDDDIQIALTGSIAPYGFYLLERTDDNSVASVSADQIYTGSLHNGGETLTLLGPSGQLIDSANAGGGGWPAGQASPRRTMERLGGDDRPGNWVTFDGAAFALDSNGNWIQGTPRQPNSPFVATATPSPSPTGTAPASEVPFDPGSVLINEIAWAGSPASASDEWIELHNTTGSTIDLTGWHLTDGGDLQIALAGSIAPYGFFLLERTDDQTISDLPADLIYGGTLSNSGEQLTLLDPGNRLIDSANGDGGGWPAGEAASRASMERRGGDDRAGHWGTFTGYGGRGLDAHGRAIPGTPGALNSVLVPTPTPTWVPGRLVINEVLIRPHYDWEDRGGVTTADEFIEIYNHGPGPVWLRGWLLDDVSGSGSRPYALPGITIEPDGFAVFFRARTHIALNDGGDSVRLLSPDGHLVDKIQYLRVRAYNLAYGRLPDGSSSLVYGLWPTPGRANVLFDETGDEIDLTAPAGAYCPARHALSSRLPRLTRTPAAARRMARLGLAACLPLD